MEKEKLDIQRIFDSFHKRHYNIAAQRMEHQDSKDREIEYVKLINERTFLLRMNVDYPFYRAAQNQFQARPSMKSHIDQLLLLIVLDICHPGEATRKDVETYWQEERRKGYAIDGKALPNVPSERDTRRLFNEYYPELFDTKGSCAEDKRKSPISSIFSIPTIEASKKAAELRKKIDGIEFWVMMKHLGDPISANNFMVEYRRSCSTLRLIDPSDLEMLLEFGPKLIGYYQTVTDRFGKPSEDYEWIKTVVDKNIYCIEPIINMLNSAVLLRWFRNLEPEKQFKLVNKDCKLKYSNDDAEKALHLFQKWFPQTHLNVQHVWMAAGEYSEVLKRPDIGATILEAALRLMPLDERDMAITFHNLAFYYRGMNNPKKAAGAFNQSKELWTVLDSPLDLAELLAWAAENYTRNGELKKGSDTLRKALNIIKSTDNDTKKIVPLAHVVTASMCMGSEVEAIEAAQMGMEISGPFDSEGMRIHYDYFLSAWLYLIEDVRYRSRLKYPRRPSEFMLRKMDGDIFTEHVWIREYDQTSVERASIFKDSRRKEERLLEGQSSIVQDNKM